MGSCSSVQRSQEETSNMKLRLSFGSKTDKLVIPPSPIKDNNKSKNGNFNDVALKSQWSPSKSTTTTTTTFTDYGNNGRVLFVLVGLLLQNFLFFHFFFYASSLHADYLVSLLFALFLT